MKWKWKNAKEIIIAVWLMSGNRVGAGIVGVPFAILNIGFIPAVIFMIVYEIIGVLTIWILMEVSELTGKGSLSDIGYYCFGRLSILG